MQNKQKVTLYIPPDLHRQLKIRAAVDADTMSNLVEQAISFYINHSDVVDEVKASVQGKTHQVHFCPECDSAVVVRDGEMISLKDQPGVLTEDLSIPVRSSDSEVAGESQGENLVPC